MKGYGVTLSPMGRVSSGSSDSPAADYAGFVQLTREIEDAGFGGVFIPEAVNDALMCSFAVANATTRVSIATWIVNIYLREPALCAGRGDGAGRGAGSLCSRPRCQPTAGAGGARNRDGQCTGSSAP